METSPLVATNTSTSAEYESAEIHNKNSADIDCKSSTSTQPDQLQTEQTKSTTTITTTETSAPQLKIIQDGIIEDRVSRIMNLLKTVSYQQPKSTTITTQSSDTSILNSTGSSLQHLQNHHSPQQPQQPFSAERTRIIRQECELQERNRLIAALKSEISRLKEQQEVERKTIREESASKISVQRKHFEALVKRTQSSLDKVLAEKEQIFKKCEQISDDFKQVEKQFKNKIQFMEENHGKELKRRKELWETAEKMKRDRWIQEKSKQIKEQTMKGFEPEIQKLIAQHKTQLQRQEEKLKAEWIKERQTMLDEHQAQLDINREKIAAERRRAADEEREIARQRYQRQLERDEMELQQQRRKMAAQFEEEKDRLLQAWKEEKKAEIDSWRVKFDDVSRQLNDIRNSNAVEVERLMRSHDLEMSRLRDALTRENEEWKQQYTKQLQKEQEKKDKLMLERLIKERDAEIEKVVRRLEEETYSNSNNMSSEHRVEVERLRNEHRDELRLLQNQLSSALEKVMACEEETHSREQDTKSLRKELLKIRNELETKDHILNEQKNDLQRLRAQRSDMRATIEKEIERDLNATQVRIRALEKTLAEKAVEIEDIHQQHAQDKCRMLKDKASELERLEKEIKDTLTKKEWENRSLLEEVEMLKAQNVQLQDLLEEQRKQFVSSLS